MRQFTVRHRRDAIYDVDLLTKEGPHLTEQPILAGLTKELAEDCAYRLNKAYQLGKTDGWRAAKEGRVEGEG